MTWEQIKEEVKQWEHLPIDWDGWETPPFPAEEVKGFIHVIDVLDAKNVIPYWAVPTSDMTMLTEFVSDTHSYKLEVDGNGSMGVMITSNGTVEFHDWDMDTLKCREF